jgi:hypothetical protein
METDFDAELFDKLWREVHTEYMAGLPSREHAMETCRRYIHAIAREEIGDVPGDIQEAGGGEG